RSAEARDPHAGLSAARGRARRPGCLSGGAPMSEERAGEGERQAQAARLHETWAPPGGWRKFSEVNNSSVGAWYTIATFGFFLFGGLLAAAMRAQLSVPENDLVSAE